MVSGVTALSGKRSNVQPCAKSSNSEIASPFLAAAATHPAPGLRREGRLCRGAAGRVDSIGIVRVNRKERAAVPDAKLGHRLQEAVTEGRQRGQRGHAILPERLP